MLTCIIKCFKWSSWLLTASRPLAIYYMQLSIYLAHYNCSRTINSWQQFHIHCCVQVLVSHTEATEVAASESRLAHSLSVRHQNTQVDQVGSPGCGLDHIGLKVELEPRCCRAVQQMSIALQSYVGFRQQVSVCYSEYDCIGTK